MRRLAGWADLSFHCEYNEQDQMIRHRSFFLPPISMTRFNPSYEIHVHGQVQLRPDVVQKQVEDALKPMWSYDGSRHFEDGRSSSYEDEPGIRINLAEHLLQMCWTVAGDEDFRQALDELCMNLNEITETGASIEITFYDSEYDDEDESEEKESRDDFVMLFVGPNPGAIMQVQRDLLVQDTVNLLERHFDGSELNGVISEIDKLFNQRFDAMVNSLEIGRPPKGGGSGRGGGRKRHLH